MRVLLFNGLCGVTLMDDVSGEFETSVLDNKRTWGNFGDRLRLYWL